MLLLETFETVGGIWLAMSGVAFLLIAAFATTRQESRERRGEPAVKRERLDKHDLGMARDAAAGIRTNKRPVVPKVLEPA
jgi:hypothetical protein